MQRASICEATLRRVYNATGFFYLIKTKGKNVNSDVLINAFVENDIKRKSLINYASFAYHFPTYTMHDTILHYGL